ncbi:MAG: ATP-binding protein [Porticoccaceae bacterium]
MLTSDQFSNTNNPADRRLSAYAAYRTLLAFVIFGMYLAGTASKILGSERQDLFLTTIATYTVLCLLCLIPLRKPPERQHTQLIFFMLLTDMVALTLMMHASGGLSSGLGFLMLPTVAAGSILVAGQLSLLLAALASICVMMETLSGIILLGKNNESIFPAGILGILLFAIAVVFQVLTQRVRAAQSLAIQKATESEQLQKLNESIVKRMRTGILVIDNKDEVKLINSAAVQLLGGQKPGSALGPGLPLRRVLPLYQQLERWKNYPWLRTPTFRADSSSLELQANFTSLTQGNEKQTLIFLEDTRTLTQHAQQLKLASLGRLTASIAHEIRNPLGAISHASQLLSEQVSDESSEKLLGIVLRHCFRVNQIVESVLQLSRQKMPEFQKLWLLQWLKKFRIEYLDTQSKDCTIELETRNKDTQIFFDPGHLTQVLTNLVDNAIRYSEQECGDRWVKLVISKDSLSELAYLDIFDKGPGIAIKDHDYIFEPFFTTSTDGSGLGLYLSRELCDANYTSLDYFSGDTSDNRYFRVGFSHPEKLLPRPS